MNSTLLKKKFKEMGSRIKLESFSPFESSNKIGITVDIKKDKKGEYFRLASKDSDAFTDYVLDVNKTDRHLLLMLKNGKTEPMKFLCGHDEREWFVAAIPESAGASSIAEAKEALKPPQVLAAQSKLNIKTKDKRKRKNDAYIRQGEWYFLPAVINPNPDLILKNEPISRGRFSSPHTIEEVYRSGGEIVYINSQYAPDGINDQEKENLIRKLRSELKKDKISSIEFQTRTKDARVWGRGTVKHNGHATIYLKGWHEVFMNTESKAKASEHIVFLD